MSARERERAILIGKTYYDRYNMYASSLQSFHTRFCSPRSLVSQMPGELLRLTESGRDSPTSPGVAAARTYRRRAP